MKKHFQVIESRIYILTTKTVSGLSGTEAWIFIIEKKIILLGFHQKQDQYILLQINNLYI